MKEPRSEVAPGPPADLADRRPLEMRLAAGDILHRFYSVDFDPIYFDRGRDGRLNAPDDRYGVLYAAATATGAFAETFLRYPGRTQLPSDLVAKKGYVRLTLRRPLVLARLAGPGLARVGATAQVVHGGKPYDIPQAWSAALASHPDGFDGIAYNARHDDEALCYALFDRCEDALEEADRITNVDDNWLWELAEPYGVGLAPD